MCEKFLQCMKLVLRSQMPDSVKIEILKIWFLFLRRDPILYLVFNPDTQYLRKLKIFEMLNLNSQSDSPQNHSSAIFKFCALVLLIYG